MRRNASLGAGRETALERAGVGALRRGRLAAAVLVACSGVCLVAGASAAQTSSRGSADTAPTLRLLVTPSIVRPGREVTVRVTGSRRDCTLAVIRSLHLVRVWTTKPHRAKAVFRAGRQSGALTVSAKCGRQTRIAPVWVVVGHGTSVLLGYEPRAGMDAGGPIINNTAASTATARPNREPVSRRLASRTVLRHDMDASAADVSLRASIASIAESQIGVSTSPASSLCNKYSASWGDGTSSGCASGLRSNWWCADFAAWVWRQAGVSFTYSYGGSNINAFSASFYAWGLATGNWHPLSSGYQPQPGDVAVYGTLNETSANDAVGHVGIVVGGTAQYPTVVNGDWGYPGYSDVYEQTKESNIGVAGGGLDGYVSVPNQTGGGTGPGGGTSPGGGNPGGGNPGGGSGSAGGTGYETAFQANTGSLIEFGAGGNVNTTQGMMPGTSPSIAALPGGGYEMAFQANTGSLIVYGTAGDINTQQGMKAGTSPAIAASPNGGFQVAFQANNGNLYIYNSSSGPANLQQGMDNNTSPSIAALAGGGYEMAFQANTGSLIVYGAGGNTNTAQGMEAGTSPAIAASSGGGFEAAFQANNGSLYIYNSSSGPANLQQGMDNNTSPSIAALAGGGYEMAFQANTGNLIVYGAGGNTNTAQGMEAGTSPAIAASSGGGFEAAFQANNGSLYIYNSSSGPANLQQGMDNNTSPSIAP